MHLKIGECIFTRNDLCISTVLGSCVCATLYDPETRWSGMFHAMLPAAPGDGAPPPTVRRDGDGMPDAAPSAGGRNAASGPCRFVDLAILGLLDRFRRRGLRPENLQAKLFGGAFCVVAPHTAAERRELSAIVDVGAKNVRMARALLLEEGVRVGTESTLGERSRKVLFHTGSGRVTMQFLAPLGAPQP